MIETASALPAYLLGLTFTLVACFLFWKAGNLFFWRAVDERVDFRCRMLVEELLEQAQVSKNSTKAISVRIGGGGGGPTTFKGPRSRIRDTDETIVDRDTADPGPIYSAASPPKLPTPGNGSGSVTLGQGTGGGGRPEKAKERDPWGPSSKEPLPPALQPVAMPVPPIDTETAIGPKKWTQPSLELTKPVKPPKNQKRPSRAGKQGKVRPKTRAKKNGRPRPSSLVLATSKKKSKEINRGNSGPKDLLAGITA